MPELYFDIKFRADQASKKTIADELNEIQQQADKAAEGSGEAAAKQTKATQAQVNAEKELIKEFRRRVTLNEVKFRQEKLSPDQALQNANSIEEWAKSQNILTNETLQGARAQKTMFLSQQRIQTGFTGVAASSARANQSLINLGRIVQDLPFGFLGISNNIDPALTSLRQLKDESGGTAGAFRLLLGALKGPGGIIFALGSLLPTAVLISQRGWNMYSKKTNEAADSTSKLRDNIASFISESSRMRGSDSFLNVRNLEQQVEAIGRLDTAIEAIKTGIEEASQAQKNYILVATDVTPFQRKFKDALDATRESLKQIQDQFGLTAEDVEILQDRMEELNGEIRRARAIASQDPLALFSDGLERATDTFIQLAEVGKVQERQLLDTAEGYREEMRALLPYVGVNDELTKKYNILNDQRQRLLDTYSEITVAFDDETFKVDVQADAIERLANQRKQDNDERERQIRQMKLLKDIPGAAEGTDETRVLAGQAMLESLRSDVAIGAAEGLAQKRLEIERQFEEKRLQLIKQFGTETEAVREALGLLEIQKHQEIERAKTEETKKSEKDRQDIRHQGWQMSVQTANNFISSLMQLNQAQSDQEEHQARKRFETHKKLAIAQALVDGAAAAVKTWKNMGGFPLAIPFVAAQAAATAVQIAAIRRTQFEGGSQERSTPSGPSEEDQPRGFFITDAGEGPLPLNGQKNNNIVIHVENRLDREGLALHVKEGNERISSRNFTVISNG